MVMRKQRPDLGTLEWFDSLSKRDFDNGSTLDEIREVYKERDRLRAQVHSDESETLVAGSHLLGGEHE